jgi:hypothetical protein
MARADGHETDQESEILALRARIAELEEELIAAEAWANQAVGAAQERLYWLDRWQVDLNDLMQRRGASEFRGIVRAVRGVYRWYLTLRGQINPRP